MKREILEDDNKAMRFIREFKLDELLFDLDYSKKYKPIFVGRRLTDRALCELFLYRSYVIWFGYQMFDTKREKTEERSSEIVSLCIFYGLFLFDNRHGLALQQVLGGSIGDLLEERWEKYKKAAGSEPGPRMLVIALCKYMGIRDKAIQKKLGDDFLDLLRSIEANAHSIGLFDGTLSLE
jgi:hypothetical protein